MQWEVLFWSSATLNVFLLLFLFLKSSPSSFLAKMALEKKLQRQREIDALKRLKLLLNDFYQEQFASALKTAQNGLLFDNEIKSISETLNDIMNQLNEQAGHCTKPIQLKIEQLDAQSIQTIQKVMEMKSKGLLLDKGEVKKICDELDSAFNETITAISAMLKT